MKSVGIDTSKVGDCLRKRSEQLLEDERRRAAWSKQALRVNGWRYSGPFDTGSVLKAICMGYATIPEECTTLLERFGPGHSRGSGAGISLMVAIFIAVGGFLAGLVYGYKNYVTKSVRTALREEVMLEVQTQMSDYAQMEDEKRLVLRPLSF